MLLVYLVTGYWLHRFCIVIVLSRVSFNVVFCFVLLLYRLFCCYNVFVVVEVFSAGCFFFVLVFGLILEKI